MSDIINIGIIDGNRAAGQGSFLRGKGGGGQGEDHEKGQQ